MNPKLRTMSEIAQERIAARALMAHDRDYADLIDRKLRQRMDNDPALVMVVANFTDSLAQVLAMFPPQTHRVFIQQCIVQALVEWESLNVEYNEQLKQAPIT
jgi:hypothetical protein